MKYNEDIHIFIKKSLGQVEVQPSIGSFEISMRKLAAAQKERKRKLFLFWLAGVFIILGTSAAVFWRPGTEPEGRLATSVLIDGKGETNNGFINEPIVPATNAINNSVKDPKTGTTKEVGSTNKANTILPVASEKSLVSANFKTATGVNEEELKYLQLELNKLPSVSFSSGLQGDTLLMNAVIMEGALTAKDLKEDYVKKPLAWYLGFGVEPQLANYEIRKNKNSGTGYDYSGNSFQDMYTKNRNEQKVLTFNYNAAVKFGFRYKDKWELLSNIGIQTYRYSEEVFKMDSVIYQQPTLTTTGMLNGTSSPTTSYDKTVYSNTYRYIYCSVQGSRIVKFKAFDLKAGMSFSAGHLLSANTVFVDSYNSYAYKKQYRNEPLNKWTYNAGISVGLIKHLNDRWQLQASPSAFYNVNSMFNKKYLVTQKPYGLGFDLSLLFRIN